MFFFQDLLLLDNEQALLSVTSLVHSFCSKRDDCTQVQAVRDVTATLVDRIGYNCRANSEAERQNIIVALKGLANVGVTTETAAILSRCATNSGNNVELRLAALDAFRHAPCIAEVS